VDLREAFEVLRFDFFDRPVIDLSLGYQPVCHEFGEPRAGCLI